MSHTSDNILLHLIFSTHQRRPLIKPEFCAELFAYLGGIIRQLNGVALIINGTADHVHMGIPVKVNIDSGGKPNGVPERR